ncbi:hypothetical protein SPRG_00474 [Saprolegnia parasitica CBS 223.65]|uniref:Ryanodine receptor Ryr domain-containing protein n=1 Tax=Saprolegnia parasitica (strain CBS 223.65) TaxID=695850 RepID=A0A067D2B6_SAPPC|nr:hypothetical protein SPRG_00474 [Saprolegnia parasitica CBS 223.65]KDO35630.1 hypothetical protein SPRG_00474 [Saprolegnia parasitica CBS 223.65]|eukprot:XP_012193958.1 hypothetical protein SPRG_00474 [Saprolegnia parasitica CBS 223.65]
MLHRSSKTLQDNGVILEDDAENEKAPDDAPKAVAKQASDHSLLTREELEALEPPPGPRTASFAEPPPSPGGRARSRSTNDIHAPSPRPPARSNSHTLETSSATDEAPFLGLPPSSDKRAEVKARKPFLMKSRSSGQWLAAAAKLKKKRTSGIAEKAKDDKEASTTPTSKSLADVAKKVVASRRAANSFKSMWPKDHPSSGSFTTIHGLHLEKKKLDLRILNAQYKEVKRSEFYEELVVYCVFLLLFFQLLSGLPFHGSFQQSDVTVDLTCSVPEVCSVSSPDGIYNFAKHLQSRICHAPAAASPTTFQTWTRVGGVRFRQIRVKPQKCALGFLHDDKQTCYPEFDEELEEKAALLGVNRTYVWHNDFEPLIPGQNSRFTTTSYGTGGYAVDLCDIGDVEELEADSYLDMATRAVSLEFVVVNPSTHVFTIASHEFVIRPSGHLEQYSQSASIRVLGLDDSPTVLSSWLWWCDAQYLLLLAVVGFVGTYLRGEISEIVKMGITSYLTLDGWNLFEMAHLLAVICTVFHIFVYFGQCRATIRAVHGVDDNDGDVLEVHTHMLMLLDTFLSLSDYAALSSAFSLLKVFKFLRMNSTLNLLWQVLGMALRDLMGYLVIFQLIFLSYSTMGSYAFGFDLEEFSTISKSYGTCFHMLAGDFPYDRLQQANPRLAPFFFVTFVVLVLQIMVNMFVAILSEYYDNAKGVGADEDDVEYDIITRAKEFMSSCSPSVELKNRESIVLRPNQTVRLISTNLVDKELKRQRAKKLFRGAVWRVVALLRFGVKFDTRLDFDRSKAPAPSHDPNRMTYIPLSENFDHATIKTLLPKGITIRFTGDSILGQDLLLRVVDHNSLSVSCVVLSHDDDDDDVMELAGGETLRLPMRLFGIHVLRILLSELRAAILRATKWWDPYEAHLVDDYHLYQLLKDERERGKTTLRFDELSRLLDLYLRKEKRNGEIDQAHVKRETALVMYRFRNSLIDMPSREKEGHEYIPNPIDTSMVELGPNLLALGEAMAENVHDIWAIERIEQGWSWGPRRDDTLKTHPNLIPYAEMSEDEQSYDVRTSMETIKTIIAMKYTIVRALKWARSLMHSSSNVSSSSSGDKGIPLASSPKASTLVKSFSLRDVSHTIKYGNEGQVYTPRPVDTSQVVFPQGLKRLMDLLAENAHEVWSKGRMDDGWTYGQARNDKLKKHVCLVPYVFLTDAEKDYDIKTAEATLKMLYALGYHIVDSNGVALS